MNILDTLLSSQGGNAVKQVGQQFGMDPAKTEDVLRRLVPALSGGIKQNLSQPGGAESLSQTLSDRHLERYAEDESALQDDAAVADGNAILGRLFGSKEVSRDVAGQVAGDTGVDAGIVKKLLPIAAAAVMGTLSKQTSGGAALGSSGGLGGLMGMLDSDGDGQVMDNLSSIGKKLF